MNKLQLPNVTLFGITGIDFDGLATAAEISMREIDFGAVKLLTHLPVEHPHAVRIKGKFGHLGSYSRFKILLMPDFIDTDFVLNIHPDGFVLNAAAWDPEFQKYDYIGAPWYSPGFPPRGGNGGFSLRSKKLIDAAQKYAREKEKAPWYEGVHPEDSWICGKAYPHLDSCGFKYAPPEVASRFSIESTPSLKREKWTNQFGFHNLYWVDPENWLKENPGYFVDPQNKAIRQK